MPGVWKPKKKKVLLQAGAVPAHCCIPGDPQHSLQIVKGVPTAVRAVQVQGLPELPPARWALGLCPVETTLHETPS